jgi:hypothetical protein
MNHILIIIGFFLLLYFLSDVKENFSQLFLPDFTNAIYTDDYYPDNTVVVRENKNRKPSAVEDVEQPPHARFVSGSENISDSPEDIREIKNDIDEVKSELDILAEVDLDFNNDHLNTLAICGNSNKKLSPANFATPWRKENENHKTLKLFERYIIQKFSPEDESCFWGDNSENGCGTLDNDCICKYKRVDEGPTGPYVGPEPWTNSSGDNGTTATSNLIQDCTGYNPTDPINGSTVSEAPSSCKRLCCNNLLFPINNSNADENDRKIYKTYLKYLHNQSEILNTGVPYIEDSLSGTCISPSPSPGPSPGPSPSPRPSPGPPSPPAPPCSTGPAPPPEQDGGVDITKQSHSTIQIVNLTTEPWLHVFLEYSDNNPINNPNDNECGKSQGGEGAVNLPVPNNRWEVNTSSGSYDLSGPTGEDDMNNSDLGAGTRWQKLSLKNGSYVILNIPDFTNDCPFRIQPLKSLVDTMDPLNSNKEWCNYTALYDNDGLKQRVDCGLPIKIEAGKEAGANMSGVDGVNFKLKWEFSDKNTEDNDQYITTFFQKNPCDELNCFTENGIKKCGCINPAKLVTMDPKYNKPGVPGYVSNSQKCSDSKDCPIMFQSGKGPGDDFNDHVGQPCYHGSCNLTGNFREWACDLQYDQCANPNTTYPNMERATSCGEGKGYTIYSYDFDDANSLAWFSKPYKMKLTFYDLN